MALLVAETTIDVMAIESGTLVEAVTASGTTVLLRATGSPQQGRDFPVVWVCTQEEYARASAREEDVRGIPWPLDAVTEAAENVGLAQSD